MEFLIRGKVYNGTVRRVKGKKLKVFFNTDDNYRIQHGFDLPNFCCNRMSCRWKSLRDWKDDLVSGRLCDFVIYP